MMRRRRRRDAVRVLLRMPCPIWSRRLFFGIEKEKRGDVRGMGGLVVTAATTASPSSSCGVQNCSADTHHVCADGVTDRPDNSSLNIRNRPPYEDYYAIIYTRSGSLK